MQYQFRISQSDLPVIASIMLVVICFCLFWFLFVSPSFKQACYKRYTGDKGIILHIILLKYTGFLLLGILPVGVFLLCFPSYNLSLLGIAYKQATLYKTVAWIFGLGVPIVMLMGFACRRKKCFDVYPQIRVQEWDAWLMIRYSTSWAVYMVGYEMMFRGLLLFPLADRHGVWPAIAVNTLFYVGSHIPKGFSETFAAILFGPLICVITLQTGTIWAAVFIHTILAVSNSMMALRFHPEFVVVKRRIPVNSSRCEMGCKCDTF